MTRWIDAFPWLDGLPGVFADSGGSGERWRSAVAELGSAERADAMDALAGAIGTHLALWTLAELFPSLSDQDIRDAVQGVATLDPRYGVANYADGTLPDIGVIELSRICDGEVAALDYAARRMLSLQLQRAAVSQEALSAHSDVADTAVAANPPELPWSPPVADPGTAAEPWLEADALSPGERRIIDDLRSVARFYAATGRPEHALASPDIHFTLPTHVDGALTRLAEIRAVDVSSSGGERAEVVEALDAALRELSPLARDVTAMRLFADEPETLDTVGRHHGVTRERVRQVAGQARARLEAVVANSAILAEVNEGISAAVGQLMPAQALLDQYPALGDTVPSVEQPVWRILDRLDDSYEIAHGWCAAPSVNEARSVLKSSIEDLADAHGVVAFEALIPHMPEYFATEPHRADLEAWCTFCGYQIRGDHVLGHTSSVRDLAAAILDIEGHPLTSVQIHARLGVERSLQSLKNALGSDQRFMRVDRDDWALVEWELDEYTSIRGLIRAQLDANESAVELSDVVTAICEKYSVKESSVVAYASAPPFETSDGVVRVATSVHKPARPPELTKRLYRVDSTWMVRVEVTEDHVRGSGSTAPASIINALDMEPGESREFLWDGGTLSVRWTGLAPAFGTIRQLLIDHRSRVGDSVFLVLRDDGSCGLKPVPALCGRTDLDLAGLVGLSMVDGFDDLVASVGGAIGANQCDSLEDLLRWTAERGDDDVQVLLERLVAERRATGLPTSIETASTGMTVTEPSAVSAVGSTPPNIGLDELISLQRDFKSAQWTRQFALAEQIQKTFGPKLRTYMKAESLDLATVLGMLDAATELETATADN